MKKNYFIVINRKMIRKTVFFISLLTAVAIIAMVFTYYPIFPLGEFESGIMPSTIEYPKSLEAETERKEVYLTFDDGPDKYTPEILDILDKYKVSATFFVVGKTTYTSYMTDIVLRGHSIGLHCYDHGFERIYRSTDSYLEDLKRIDDIVYEETGIHSKIVRFPGGSSVRKGTTKSRMSQLCEIIQENNYQYFDWNCESSDKAGVRTVSGVMSRIKATAKRCGNIIIVLMHDTEKVTVDSLPQIIEYFQEQDCMFMRLTETSPAVHHM